MLIKIILEKCLAPSLLDWTIRSTVHAVVLALYIQATVMTLGPLAHVTNSRGILRI